MGFNINNKKNRQSIIFSGNKNYHKLRSIEDLSNFINTNDNRLSTTSTNSEIRMPTRSTYNKRFSEQSFNSISNVSIADTYCSSFSGSTTASVMSTDLNNIYSYYQTNSGNNDFYDNTQGDKRNKKHRKRKALSKLFQSFSFSNQLQQSMQCPDWEYYCNQKNYNIY
ncbi:hypothetical protein BCR32DRAFT_276547 [Anaeromyces robustus]|jgi:hypothetical protein|uniref:Uncharacterized protein n=1 Tax=Anaeromyces robustus TaxID=1754192 RepID=A0A1Y1XHA5_9FUNG|nr:hypothetical protein BCR32DRAFT_276547 [Anaeromyces robustus]|eukprot:ORX85131.1 hypothetical protein BCR32DRAFT_276547 [Anaeromyces robustus]